MLASDPITPLERWTAHSSDSRLTAIAGAVGGFAAGVATCPLDVIKTKLQAQGGLHSARNGMHIGQKPMYNGLVGTASVIWRDEGIRGMYRGLGPIIMGYLPTWAVWFTVYNESKKWVGKRHTNTDLVNFYSAIIAGGSSTIVTNPIWVIKTRLMSQSGPRSRTGSWFAKSNVGTTAQHSPPGAWNYNSTFDAARQMYRGEGLRAFYSGLTPALLGLSHVAVQFPAYEYLRRRFTGHGMGVTTSEGDSTGKEWAGILSASILSKIMASSATYPHEVIRTRLQTQVRPSTNSSADHSNGTSKAPQSQLKYHGIIRTFRVILAEEGWTAFYAGMATNMVRAVPAATVTMVTYEYVMRSLNKSRTEGRRKLDLA